MKKIAFILSVVSLTFVSCNRVEPQPERSMVEKEFTVVSEETKTDLGNNGVSILWSANDKITVIAATTGNEYDFDITDGVGNTTAKFSGQLDAADATETTFYAVYPNIKESTFSGDIVKVGKSALGHTALAIKDGIDPAFTVMAAKSVDGSAFSFKHGMSYCKIEIDQDGIQKVKISVDGGGRVWGRPNIDVTNSDNTTQDKGKSDDNYMEIALASGTLAQGIYYIPVTVKPSSSLGNVTIEYTKGGITKSVTTSKLSSAKMKAGKIYDMGCPPIAFHPVINASNVIIAAADEGGTITYTVDNEVSGGVMSATIQDAGTISNLALGTPASGSLTFTCDANTETTAKAATVRLTYTYNDPAETVTKDVVINQAPYGGSATPETHTHVFYVNSSSDFLNTSDGSDGTFFTLGTKQAIASLSAGDTGNYNMASWTIDGITSTKGLKLEGGTTLTFTTSATLNSTVRFYYACRKTGDASGARIKITPAGGTAQVFNTPFGSVGDSGELTLAKDTQCYVSYPS